MIDGCSEKCWIRGVKLSYYIAGVTGGWILGRLSRIYKCGGCYTWHAREVVLGGANERLPLGDRYGYQSFAALPFPCIGQCGWHIQSSI